MNPWGSFQVNETTNVVFMILSGCFISEIVLNFSFRWVKKILNKIRLHVYTSLRAGVARSGQPIKTLNDKFSLSEKTSFVQSKAVNDDFSPSEISSFLMPIGYC